MPLQNWENEMKTMEHKLAKTSLVEGNLADSKDIPPVRGRAEINVEVRQVSVYILGWSVDSTHCGLVMPYGTPDLG